MMKKNVVMKIKNDDDDDEDDDDEEDDDDDDVHDDNDDEEQNYESNRVEPSRQKQGVSKWCAQAWKQWIVTNRQNNMCQKDPLTAGRNG